MALCTPTGIHLTLRTPSGGQQTLYNLTEVQMALRTPTEALLALAHLHEVNDSFPKFSSSNEIHCFL